MSDAAQLRKHSCRALSTSASHRTPAPDRYRPAACKRLVVIEECADARALAAAKVEYRRERRVNRGAARSSTALEPPKKEGAVAEITKLLRDESDLLPGVAELLEVLSTPSRPGSCRARSAVAPAGSHSKSGVADSTNPSNIEPVERLHISLGDLDVLPGHRLRPILGEAFGGSTGLVDVGVTRYPDDLPLHPLEQPADDALGHVHRCLRATVFPDGDRQHAVAEVENLLDLMMVIFQVAQ